MFRIRKNRTEKYLYALGAHDARLVKILGTLGFVSLFFMILGYFQFLHVSPWIALLFSPVLVITILYHAIQYLLLSFYPGFDAKRHNQKVADYWQITIKRSPKIAVFIPAAGEPLEVVEATVRAATKIKYPNFRVFILDDSKDGIYKPIALSLETSYVRRKNTGEHKKAGNMNNALKYLDGYDSILVLDADFQARPEILRELVPYSARDVGIIQSPQHFPLDKNAHSRSKIEYGAAYIQQDFYRITQVARNKFGAAICVGTCALYSLSALRRVGGYEGVGTPKGWAHSEDVHTGLKMLNAHNEYDEPYRIAYVPIQLAEGSCPDTAHSFYKQQNRWATGSMQLLFSDKTIFSSRLTSMQRLIYGSNSLYYFYTTALLLSPLYLLALALSSQPSSWAFTLYFIPLLVTRYVVEPFVLRKQRAPLATSLVVISNAYTYLQAFFLLIIKKPLGWEATGTTEKKKSSHFTFFKLVATSFFIVIYVATLSALIINEHFEFGPSIFIVCMFLSSFLAHVAFLFYTLLVSTETKHRLLDRKLYASLLLCVLTTFGIYISIRYHDRYDIVIEGNHIVFQEDKPSFSGGSIVDGYKRSVGDVKEILGL